MARDGLAWLLRGGMLSAWLIIPIGYLVMALMARWDRRQAAHADAPPAAVEQPPGQTT